MVKKIVLSGLMLGLAACGSSSGGGDGGAGTDTGLIQASKMSCNNSACMGTGSLSLMGFDGNIRILATDVENAVSFYNAFNQQMIPAMNSVLKKIETGIKAGGATSCSDISTNFTGDVTVDGTVYNAKTATSAQAGPASMSRTTMTKKLAARLNGGSNFVQADYDCGAESDASPLIGRVLANDGTNQLNAWYERGSAQHVRMMMVAKSSGQVYGAWFKTDDGDNYQIILATMGTVYLGAGNKTAGKINFQVGVAGTPTCLNSATGAAETCSYTIPTVTHLHGSLLNSGTDATWASISNATVLASPMF